MNITATPIRDSPHPGWSVRVEGLDRVHYTQADHLDDVAATAADLAAILTETPQENITVTVKTAETNEDTIN